MFSTLLDISDFAVLRRNLNQSRPNTPTRVSFEDRFALQFSITFHYNGYSLYVASMLLLKEGCSMTNDNYKFREHVLRG